MKRLVLAACVLAVLAVAGIALAQQASPPPPPPPPVSAQPAYPQPAQPQPGYAPPAYPAQPVPQPAYAAPRASVRFDHRCFDEGDPDRVAARANALGAEGWEMVGGASVGRRAVWCFKRRLP